MNYNDDYTDILDKDTDEDISSEKGMKGGTASSGTDSTTSDSDTEDQI